MLKYLICMRNIWISPGPKIMTDIFIRVGWDDKIMWLATNSFSMENFKETDNLEHTGIDGGMILKEIEWEGVE